jgi:hypothetical protein
MDNNSGRKAGAEMIRSRPSGSFMANSENEKHLRLREVQLRTRWTSTEKSVKIKNACARFVASSVSQLAGPFYTMRDLFAGTLDEQSEQPYRAAPLQRPAMDRHSSFAQSHYPRTYDKLEVTYLWGRGASSSCVRSDAGALRRCASKHWPMY